MENENYIIGNLKYKYRFFLTLDYFLKKIGINFFKAFIYAKDLKDFVLEESNDNGFIIKECNMDDLPKFGELMDLFLSDMQNGHILIAAFLDDQWVGYNWVSFKPVEVEEVERSIHFNGAYTWRAYVKKEYRRRGIMKEIKFFIFDLIKNKYNKSKAYAITETSNKPNINALESYGYLKVGKINYSRFFFWRKYEENIENNTVTLLYETEDKIQIGK